MALTPAGQAYYERVHAAFELLRQGTGDIRAPQRPRRRLRIGLLSSFATRWLAPRLPAFSAAHPDIELQLQPTSAWRTSLAARSTPPSATAGDLARRARAS